MNLLTELEKSAFYWVEVSQNVKGPERGRATLLRNVFFCVENGAEGHVRCGLRRCCCSVSSRAHADYPIASHRYLADPASLVHDGRLYLYASNDDDNVGDDGYKMASIRLHFDRRSQELDRPRGSAPGAARRVVGEHVVGARGDRAGRDDLHVLREQRERDRRRLEREPDWTLRRPERFGPGQLEHAGRVRYEHVALRPRDLRGR